MATASPARIRRCVRDLEYAVAQSPGILATRPDAKPTGSDDFTLDSFWDTAADATVMNNERFGILSSSRKFEAAESAEPLRIGTDVPVAPALPRARMRDSSRRIDRSMLVCGISVDQ